MTRFICVMVIALPAISSQAAIGYKNMGKDVHVADGERSLMIVYDAVVDKDCATWDLSRTSTSWGGSAVHGYYRTAYQAKLHEHLDYLSFDGTRQSSTQYIKSTDDLKGAFRNVLNARCLYSVKMAGGVSIYRISQDLRFPGGEVRSAPFILMEVCSERAKCQLTFKFDYTSIESFLKIFDASVGHQIAQGRFDDLASGVRGKYALAPGLRPVTLALATKPLASQMSVQEQGSLTSLGKVTDYRFLYQDAVDKKPSSISGEVVMPRFPAVVLTKAKPVGVIGLSDYLESDFKVYYFSFGQEVYKYPFFVGYYCQQKCIPSHPRNSIVWSLLSGMALMGD